MRTTMTRLRHIQGPVSEIKIPRIIQARHDHPYMRPTAALRASAPRSHPKRFAASTAPAATPSALPLPIFDLADRGRPIATGCRQRYPRSPKTKDERATSGPKRRHLHRAGGVDIDVIGPHEDITALGGSTVKARSAALLGELPKRVAASAIVPTSLPL